MPLIPKLRRAEEYRSLCVYSHPHLQRQLVPGESGLHSETVFHENNNNKTHKQATTVKNLYSIQLQNTRQYKFSV